MYNVRCTVYKCISVVSAHSYEFPIVFTNVKCAHTIFIMFDSFIVGHWKICWPAGLPVEPVAFVQNCYSLDLHQRCLHFDAPRHC